MNTNKYRIAFSRSGGLYLGENIRSRPHSHSLIALVISFSGHIEIRCDAEPPVICEAALIPCSIEYSLNCVRSDLNLFIHIDPFSRNGLRLHPVDNRIQGMNRSRFSEIISLAQQWIDAELDQHFNPEDILDRLVEPLKPCCRELHLDSRIRKVTEFLEKAPHEDFSPADLAKQAYLSQSRFSHLFKEQTGITLKKYLQHRKLLKALEAMNNQMNLTDSTYIGGFTDQPHFWKAFTKSFGIAPSQSLNRYHSY